MARVKRGTQVRKRHKKILSLTKGYKLGRNNLFRQAKQATLKAGVYAYRDRRNKKRLFRRLWIVQLNAATRSFGLSYGQFINGLNKAEIKIDRRVLAEMTMKAPDEFAAIVGKVKEALLAEGK
ncbi:MAG TPA: 50S ribosomal protein L20 [Candidatus Saccharimonadales bacterium]|nr:50S ribosomal protein L20 [Candidatus Saccharimonadales bacterium]